MTERNFREKVYEKCMEVVKTHKFPGEWSTFLRTNVLVTEIFNDNGPFPSAVTGLNLFRLKIVDEAKKQNISIPELIVKIAKAGEPYSKWNTRAAFMKVMLHFTKKANRHAQEIWIYSPPVAYWRWIFDLLNGTDSKVLMWLKKDEEVYSEFEKETMVDSVQMALAVSQKAISLLGSPDERTLRIVEKWFIESEKDLVQVKQVAATLLDGFKKISDICNSNKLIFSDDPFDRKSLIEYEEKFGSVYKRAEKNMYVMYIAGGYKKAVNIGEHWKCALTVLHEASHIGVSTGDVRYDTRGLKPSIIFPAAQAIKNADSWAYFAMDLAGYLPANTDSVVYF
ncbi:M35 family metallo-endopeptidase [Massilia sp. W12]|uniref:M35 family metallo-endopeptidase n=1 Tax=Massilia sp. W12 TaxID=3126507 RepID=UPI0030CC0FA8